MKQIQLTGKHAQKRFVLIDDKDYDLLKIFKWHALTKKQPYACHTFYNPQRLVLMHRWIMGDPVDMEVDHINGDIFDNRRSNLRICTKLENRQNKGNTKRRIEGYKGVVWHKGIKKWEARICVNRKMIALGVYLNPKDGAKAYNEAAKQYFGQYARLNDL